MIAGSRGSGLRRIARHARRFARDERGAIIAFVLPLFLLMLLGGGAAIDFMRHEATRARLQDAIDRGVLAAANLSQSLDAEVVVRDYMKSAGFGPEMELTVIAEIVQPNERRITAVAGVPVDTTFLNLAGIPRLNVAVTGTAQESRRDIEVSLVLDISTSMIEIGRFAQATKIDMLVPAAQSFVDAVITDQSRSLTSINLIPYAGQVNIRPLINQFRISAASRHADNSCIEVNEAVEFGQTGLPNPNALRDQVPFFQFSTWTPQGATFTKWGWCPTDDSAIVVQSNDSDALKGRIASLSRSLHEATGTQYGMKWALSLLDPSSRPIVGPAGSDDFRDRPLDWNPAGDLEGASKIIVLMTDGKITLQYRPDANTRSNRGRMNRLRTEELSRHNDWRETRTSEAQNVAHFKRLCDLARDNNVRVFTIGYDVVDDPNDDDDVADQLRRCATFESDFFRVEGANIAAAFQSIAGQINRLKLVN
ncbi:MAG: pilus assembly protein TadG-related protein [Thermohalobaculum sp.]|nr:pilus assembly protein TadG-related protein [Thermohalobaculum sp.]